MDRGEVRRGSLIAVAATVLGVLVAQIAIAAGGSGNESDEIAGLKRDNVGLQRQIDELKSRFSTVTSAKSRRGRRGPPGPPGAQGPPGPAGAAPACQGDGSGDVMVAAGAVCIDKYEVSVWSSPTGGTQYGATADDYPCGDDGQDCKAGTAGEIYARSVPGVTPSRFITYFQAQAALANVGKRLPSNAEWQQAAAGTP